MEVLAAGEAKIVGRSDNDMARWTHWFHRLAQTDKDRSDCHEYAAEDDSETYFFLQNNRRQYNRDDQTHFIDGSYLRGFSQLQGTEVKQPGKSRRHP